MKERIGKFVMEYIKENTLILFLLLIVFVIGISIGAFTVNSLNSTQKGELYNYINGFLESKNINISQVDLFKQIFINYFKFIIILWFLGMTVIGMPLIFGLIGFKAFTIGFTVGFMLDVFTDARGILIIMSSVIPQTLIVLPCIVILCVSGVRLSLFLLKGGNQKRFKGNEVKVKLISHTLMAILIIGVIAFGALLESFVLPMFLNIISSNFNNSV